MIDLRFSAVFYSMSISFFSSVVMFISLFFMKDMGYFNDNTITNLIINIVLGFLVYSFFLFLCSKGQIIKDINEIYISVFSNEKSI